jgi:hypothetical protein
MREPLGDSVTARTELPEPTTSAVVRIGTIMDAMRIAKVGDEMPRFWMVWRGGSWTSRYKHRTIESALTECAKLAALHPQRRFYVMEAIIHCDGFEDTSNVLAEDATEVTA